jgi:hypothetical protein
MTLVPVVTLLFGYFPVALNVPTVAAITAYYVALHALTFYSRSVREFRALWLANVGTSVMFWVYAKAALLTPFKQVSGKGLAFKATSKGAHRCRRRCGMQRSCGMRRRCGMPLWPLVPVHAL